eukprot:366024-Chlamydomonas_euryale.AAC.8
MPASERSTCHASIGALYACSGCIQLPNCLWIPPPHRLQVRTHFAEWCASHASDFDVRLDNFKPMEYHARFKYLVHLDGQGLSSRLDQLFVMRSLVLKEDSGYRAFYHHLLKPYEHYIPL